MTDAPRPGMGPGIWRYRGGELSLDRPRIIGILNVTPDSFSDGGRHLDPRRAADRARAMVRAGADLVDVGGESTRPGAALVPVEDEWDRIGPVLEAISELPVPISVDTRKAEVARRSVESGAAIVNDVSGLSHDPEMAGVVARSGVGVVLMHMRGTPATMQEDTRYEDVMGEVAEALEASVRRAVEAGCDPRCLAVDPGIGFGKSASGSLELLARLGELKRLGCPVLVGPSRKSFIGRTLDLPVEERVEGTIAACVAAWERGARIFRVHDVEPVRRALDLASAIEMAGAAPARAAIDTG